ncbi:MAG: hypothetical protein CSA58_05745 [Micrococcales bacterium]|nr:MAG: hypothetical protein CSA58_05745 [Micrococcales bacterium]
MRTGALPVDVPRMVADYQVRGLWHADDVGVILDAVDGFDRRVELVLLSGAPNNDPFARQTFLAAAAEADVLASGDHDGVAWAALPAGAGPRGAQPMLAAVWPDPSDEERKGPHLVPHWKGQPAAYPARPALLFGSTTAVPWWWWLVALLLAVTVFLLLASCLPDRDSQPTPTPSESSGSPTESSPPPTPSGSTPSQPTPSGSPTPGQTGPGDRRLHR